MSGPSGPSKRGKTVATGVEAVGATAASGTGVGIKPWPKCSDLRVGKTGRPMGGILGMTGPIGLGAAGPRFAWA